jgi:hypothetical protein
LISVDFPRSILAEVQYTTYMFDLSGNDNLASTTPGELVPVWLAVLCFEFHILIDSTSMQIQIIFYHVHNSFEYMTLV